MSVYATDWAGALADVRAAGAAVSFVGATTVSGYAIRTKGNPKRYVALKLVETESPTLFFVPSTFGTVPALNDLVTFGGTEYAVADVEPFMPDGTAIFSRVIVTR